MSNVQPTTKLKRSSVRLVAEEPVGLSGDALGFTAYAQTLADAARESIQPLTIGIFGEWGTGKSSLMRMVSDSLQKHENIVIVECNAWQYQHKKQPLFPLITSVIRHYDDYRSGRPKAMGAVLEQLKRAVIETDADSLDSQLITQISAAPFDMSDRLDALINQSQYAQAFQLLSEIEVPQGWKFVVMVDDLDRCSPERAVRLLESIKLVLSQPGFVFILGVSRAVIEEHLEYQYREVLGVTNFNGSSYLEKLVQLPFPIPSHRDRISGLAKDLTTKIEEPDIVDLLEMLGAVFDYNPRALIRVVNNLIIDRSINENLRTAGRMDKVPLKMFAISRALQHRWPSVHRLLELSNTELAESVANWRESGIPDPDQETLDAIKVSEDQAYLARAMRESSELTSLLHSDAGTDWLNDERSRVAAAQFVRKHERESPKSNIDDTEVFDAYISYPKTSENFASDLYNHLINTGFNVFVDTKSILPGEKSRATIEKSLKAAQALIFLFGASTVESTNQRQEVIAMLDRQDSSKPPVIIPVVLPGSDHVALSKNFPELARYKGIELNLLGGVEPDTHDPSYDFAMRQIQRALEKRSKMRGNSKQ